MRVTVTGGAGFIGSHLVDRLIRSGHRVQVIDNWATGLREQIPEAAEWFDGCITAASTAEAVAGFAPQRLVHLAAQVDVRISVNEPVHDAMINVAGTVAMLDAAQRGGSLEAAVLGSSAAVYGVQRTPLAQEDHPIEPISGYGAVQTRRRGVLGSDGALARGAHAGAALCERVRSSSEPKG